MAGRTPANGEDVSATDFSDGAWDSNEMMRGEGDAESEPLEPDDDDEIDGDQPLGDEEGDEPELEADEDGDDELEGEEGEEEAEPEEELEPIEPMPQWPAEFQAQFAQLPPQAQHFVMDTARSMQADYTRKTTAIAQERQFYSGLTEAIRPRAEAWALNGMNPIQAINQVLALSDYAGRDPVGFAQHLCKLRGIDLQAELAKQAPNPEEYVDPQVAALRQPLSQVQARLNQFEQQMAQREQMQQRQAYQQTFHATSAAIDNFASQTGQDGKPLYPFFDTVIDDITAQINAGVRSIPEAYNKAVWANPTTRAKMLARSRSSENAKALQRAQEARRSASSISGHHGGNGSVPTGDMSVGQLLRAAYRGDIGP